MIISCSQAQRARNRAHSLKVFVCRFVQCGSCNVCTVNVTNFPIFYSLFQDSHLYALTLSQGHSILTLTNKTFNSTRTQSQDGGASCTAQLVHHPDTNGDDLQPLQLSNAPNGESDKLLKWIVVGLDMRAFVDPPTRRPHPHTQTSP